MSASNPTSSTTTPHLSLYQSMIQAQFTTENPSNDNNDSTHPPPLDPNYLIWLKNTTILAWPDIKESSKAEQQYYRTRQFDNGVGGFFENTTEEGTLSQMYGPLNPGHYTVQVERGTWVRSYRSWYAYFPGTDDELLRLMAEAYSETKKELRLPGYTRPPPRAAEEAAKEESAVVGWLEDVHDEIDLDFNMRSGDPYSRRGAWGTACTESNRIASRRWSC